MESVSAEELMSYAREWVADCLWADVDEETVDELSDESIRRGVERHYAGGWAEFRLAAGLPATVTVKADGPRARLSALAS